MELMQRPIGGLGILLIKELTDELSWCREEGKNSLTLIFAKRHA
jgi:anti-sigma regulatory factor (Ser/Thr protein kinase)